MVGVGAFGPSEFPQWLQALGTPRTSHVPFWDLVFLPEKEVGLRPHCLYAPFQSKSVLKSETLELSLLKRKEKKKPRGEL